MLEASSLLTRCYHLADLNYLHTSPEPNVLLNFLITSKCQTSLAVVQLSGTFKAALTLTRCLLQPINTGFSFSEDERDRVYDEKTVSADMLDFLLTFLDGKICIQCQIIQRISSFFCGLMSSLSVSPNGESIVWQ